MSLLKANPDQFKVEKNEIIVAQGNLKSGTILDKSNVAIRRVPAEFAGSYSISPRDAEGVLGKKLNRNLKTGDPILIEFLQKI